MLIKSLFKTIIIFFCFCSFVFLFSITKFFKFNEILQAYSCENNVVVATRLYDGIECINVGNFFVYNKSELKNEIDEICEIIDFNKENVSKTDIVVFFKAKFIKKEIINDIKIYYYYSPLLEKQLITNKGNFNLQIIDNKKQLIVAYPINCVSF